LGGCVFFKKGDNLCLKLEKIWNIRDIWMLFVLFTTY
jgi:hypothetical protein